MPQSLPADQLVGNVHVKMTEQVIDANTGELVDVETKNFDMAVIQAPSLTDKVKIGLTNLADKAKVDLLNASVSVKEDVIAGALNFKDDLSKVGTKIVQAKDQFVRDVNDRITDKKVENAIESANVAIERADQVIRDAELTL